MNRPQTRQRPVAAGRACRNRIEYGKPSTRRLPHNWRDRLPDPATYYAAHVAKLGKPDAKGWASARCPFHDDHHPSLGVHIASERGAWCCRTGCGKGGDLIGFHMRLRNLAFPDAVRELIGGAR